jgi:hypothetical protein
MLDLRVPMRKRELRVAHGDPSPSGGHWLDVTLVCWCARRRLLVTQHYVRGDAHSRGGEAESARAGEDAVLELHADGRGRP